jgi:hypothetical protein
MNKNAVFCVSLLILSLMISANCCIPTVKSSPDIHQGDLILQGNNVTTIEGRLDINGSIIVIENATLLLRGALLNFTQTDYSQYNITLSNPSNGNPRLLAYNSTITSAYTFNVYLRDNSTTNIENCTINSSIVTYDHSMLSVSSESSVGGDVSARGSSIVEIHGSTIQSCSSFDSPWVQVYDSEITSLQVGPRSINCTITNLEPEFVHYWSFIINCSVNIPLGGSTPNITVMNTNVNNWKFAFYGSSSVSISDSILSSLHNIGSSFVSVVDSVFTSNLYASKTSTILLINSTYYRIQNVLDQAKIQIAWHLNVHVIDSIGQDVPSANVTAVYLNGTLAESKFTDSQGWARLALMEKMINETGNYAFGNFSIEATYDIHSDATTVNMTGNQQTTLTLEDFVIPEFPSLLILPLFTMATLLAAIAYRRKHFA